MARTSDLADSYRRRFPGVQVGEAQAAEREERLRIKERPAASRRQASILVPELPWKRSSS